MQLKKFFRQNWVFLSIVALWLVFCSPYILKGLVPFPSRYLVSFFPPWSASYAMPVKNAAIPDVITQIYPWKTLTVDTWKIGQIPLWNPFSFSGTVHAGNYQSAVFTPFNILYFLLPFIDAWSILILLQPLLAGVGMLLFLRAMDMKKEAQLLGSVSFMFCGFMVTWMAYGTLGYSILFLPYALFAIHELFRQARSHAGYGILLSAAISLSLLSGHFQISLYVIIASAAYGLFLTVQKWELRRGLSTAGFMILGILIAFPQLLLTFDAYTESVRSGSFVKGEVIPWKYIVTFIAPDYFGHPVTRNDWFGHYAEWMGFIGVIPVLLSLYSVFFSGAKGVRFFVYLAVFSILLSYRTPLVDALFMLRIPVLSTSAASRIIVLSSFSLCVLAADGLAYLTELKGKKSFRLFSVPLAVLVFLWITVFVFRLVPPEYNSVALRNSILPTVMALVMVQYLVGVFQKRTTVKRFFLVILLLASMGDSYRFAVKWMPFEPKGFVYPADEMLTSLKQITGNDRVFGNLGGEVGVQSKVPLIEGYDAMYQGRYATMVNYASRGTMETGGRSVVMADKYGRYRDRLFALLNVRYIVHKKSDNHAPWTFPVWEFNDSVLKKIKETAHYELYENTKALPKAYLTSSYLIQQNEKEQLQQLFDPDFDPAKTVLLETKPIIEPEKTERAGEVRIDAFTPNRINLKSVSDKPQILVISDVYDKGWKVLVDGKASQVMRANFDLRAVPLGAGIHDVTMYYFPDSLRTGLAVSFIALGILGYRVVRGIYENRHI